MVVHIFHDDVDPGAPAVPSGLASTSIMSMQSG